MTCLSISTEEDIHGKLSGQIDTAEQRQQQMENTRNARQAPGPIEASDVENLLAAINKHEAREKGRADRSTKAAPEIPEPMYSPTHRPRRVADILDSLSALLVSEHEVVATALRVDANTETIEFIIATNEDVPSATSSHIASIWTSLQQISKRYYELYPGQNASTQVIKDDQLRSQLYDFNRQCIEFSFKRLQKRVNSRFPDFARIDRDKSSEDHPFRRVHASILGLEAMFTREQGAVFGKPHNQEHWKSLLDTLRLCKKSIKDFLNKGGFTQAELLYVQHFEKWETYLRKIAAVMNDVDILRRAAFSSSCRHMFLLSFKQHAIPSMSSRAQSVPQTANDWETVLEKALSFQNNQERHNYQFEPKVMCMSVIMRDTTYMAQEDISKDLVMHCEMKILLAIAEAEANNPHLAKAYSYIGV